MSITPSDSFSAAWAGGEDAVREATAEAVKWLAGARPKLVVFFADAERPSDQVIEQAVAGSGGAPLAGMSATGVITEDGLRHGGCSAIAFGGEDLAVGIGVAGEASRDLRRAGAAAAAAAVTGLALTAGHAVVLLFVDPKSGDERQAIAGAYEVVGGRVPLAGGGANGASPTLYADGSAHADAVVAVALSSSASVEVATAHGCRPRGTPALVTRARGRTVMELNGRPAESVYLELVGRPGATLTDAEFEALAVLHPLAKPELRGHLRLRHVTGRATDGGLACVTPIPQNAAIWLAEQTEQTIVESAVHAVDAVTRNLPRPPKAALVFDCAARRRALGPRVAEEAKGLVSAFGGELALAGLYTRGEVGRTRGSKGDLNHAVVVVGFG
jgi:hypothetical protein